MYSLIKCVEGRAIWVGRTEELFAEAGIIRIWIYLHKKNTTIQSGFNRTTHLVEIGDSFKNSIYYYV